MYFLVLLHCISHLRQDILVIALNFESMSSTRLEKQCTFISCYLHLSNHAWEPRKSRQFESGEWVVGETYPMGRRYAGDCVCDCLSSHSPLPLGIFCLCLTLQVLKGLGNVNISIIAFRPKGAVQAVIHSRSAKRLASASY